MYNLRVNSDKDREDSSKRVENERPEGSPNASKDFNRILKSRERETGEENRNSHKKGVEDNSPLSYEEIASAEETVREQPSLFDLSKGLSRKTNLPSRKEELAQGEDVAKMVSADELPAETTSKTQALKDKKSDSKTKTSLKADEDEEDLKNPSVFPRESIDLSYVNPDGMAKQNQINAVAENAKIEPSHKMTTQELVEAVVKAITTMTSQDKTDTIVTLKHPPLFEGANLVLTSFESAKGEFNIRFENLTQQAQTFMDMQQNQESLRHSLMEKGYTVHIVVNTTLIETPVPTEQTAQTDRQREQQEDQDNPQQQKRHNRQDQA